MEKPIQTIVTSAANLGDVVKRGLPQKIALIDCGMANQERNYTYRELDQSADAFGWSLAKAGIGPGDQVAFLAQNSVSYIIALLGVLRLGAIAVPINFRLPSETVAAILADCQARLVLVDEENKAKVPLGLPVWGLNDPSFVRRCTPSKSGPFPSFRPSSRDAALMLYTSGSTGMPKGVLISHASQIWVAQERCRSHDLRQERVLIAAPLCHMNALGLVFYVLTAHSSAVLLPRFEAAAYLRAIAKYRITWLTAVPPMIAMLLHDKKDLLHADLSSVRVVRMGSAPVSPALRSKIRDLLPHAQIVNAYGTTESSPIAFGAVAGLAPVPETAIGYPLPGVSVRLRAHDGSLGEEGVLEIKSPGLMLGYHHRPDKHPFTSDGYYITGDVFRRDEQGTYYFVGREDDMFVCGGENLYPGPIERVLEQHPAVLQACVVPVPDEIKGEKPAAFVVLRPDAKAPSEEELKAFSLQHLPAYAHPRWIWFVKELPLAATQKIDRKKLTELAKAYVDSKRSS